MKKTVCFILAVFLLGTSCFAAPDITGKNLSDDIINISGNANIGDDVSIVIINPGYVYSDAQSQPENALQFFRSYETTENKYSFDVKISIASDGGGSFLTVINVGGIPEEFTFDFYPAQAKLGIIEEINRASSATELTQSTQEKPSFIERCFEIYSANKIPITAKVNKALVAQILISERGDGYSHSDADAMSCAILSSICIAALNENIPDSFDGDKLKYHKELGLSKTDIYEKYMSQLNPGGIAAVKNAIVSKGFKTLEQMQSAFKDAVILNLFTNNAKYGSGHVETLLSSYSSELTAKGFNLSKLSSISNKLKFYDRLVSSKAQSLLSLADIFNSYKEAYSPSQSGSSSASSVSNTGSAPLYVPENEDVSLIFTDLADVLWAEEAIIELSKLKIINGKGNGLFDPQGTVTRAEFTKMLVGALGLDTSSSSCTFTDVTAKWAMPYIAAAASAGIVNGIDNLLFEPDGFMTREQGAVMCYRGGILKNLSFGGSSAPFTDDLSISSWAKEAVYSLGGEKIISGFGDGSFAPQETMTRAQAAKLIYSLYNTICNLQ